MGVELQALTAFRDATFDPERLELSAPIHSTQFLKDALASAGVGTWQFDKLTGLMTWDAVTNEILGREPVTTVSDALAPVHREDRAMVRESLNHSLRTGEPYDIVFRAHHAAGGLLWLHALARPIPDELGARYLAGTVSDITERKMAANAVKERERELRAVIENLPGITYRSALQPPWQVSFVSAGVEELTGFKSEALTSGGIYWGDLIASEDRQYVEETVARAVAARCQYELRYRICTGRGMRWVHERGKASYGDDGTPLFLEGFVGDVHEQATADDKLRETEERYRLVIQATGDLIWDWDLETNTVAWLEVQTSSFGYPSRIIGEGERWWSDRLHPEERRRVMGDLSDVLKADQSQYSGKYRFRRADGTYADVFDRGCVIRDRANKAIRMVGAMQDLTEQNAISAELRHSKALSQSILDASADCIKIISPDGSLKVMNRPGMAALELDCMDQVRGLPWVELWPLPMRPLVQAALNEAKSGTAARFTGSCPTARGTPKWWDVVVTPMWSDLGEVEQLLAISRDITAGRKSADDLKWASEHDHLTELPNRRSFEAHLQATTLRAMETGSNVGLLLLDLDHFKHVNDTLGHAAGDHLLKVFGERLQSSLRTGDFVARLGGDEFAVILPNVNDAADLLSAGESILARLQGPVIFDGRPIGSSASIGGALFPRDADNADGLFKYADTALYNLKASGRGGTKLFHSYMREEMQRSASQISLAKSAIANNTIVPYYQPKVDLRTGRTMGFEALLRWVHPIRGVQTPDTISEAFQEYELGSKIGELMQNAIFRDMAAWRANGVEYGIVSLNASPAEFLRDDYAERLLSRVHEHGLRPHEVEVEITEHVFAARGMEFVSRALKVLHDAGVRISLDDFGTGYSSLSHLRDFPVDVVKIDRSFVAKVLDEPEVAAIVTAIIDLAASLSMDVVAEGVETEEQASLLRNAGCSFGQGYLFSRAAAAHEVARIFAADYAVCAAHSEERVPIRCSRSQL
jgi:diguanylate cyclase (GGDEF)-like protein/PAS domain S-box-containing protein